MKFPLLLLLFLPIFIGCKKTSTLELSNVSFLESDLDLCKNDPCSAITIEYIQVNADEEIAEKINNKIQSQIIETLFLGEDDRPSAKTIEEAARQFIIAYRDHKNEFEYNLEYEAEVVVSKLSENENILSLQFQNYLFTGGAHGYGSTLFFNFDKETGEEIPTEKLFENFDEFLALAENEFRKEYEIPDDESINYPGFWFEEETFSLPDSIGFSKTELIFIYNQYDIASYAAGPIVFTIPKKKANPYLKEEFQ